MQERIVQLYFVRGWQLQSICERYQLGKSTVRKLLSDWKVRAIAAGYIIEIDAEALATLAGEAELHPREEFDRPELRPLIATPEPLWHTGIMASATTH